MNVSPCHVSFDVRDASQTGEVRRAAVRQAEELGFDDVATGRVALIATELGNNLVRHAVGGRILVGTVREASGATLVELLSLDRGPGMSDLQACFADGYSTGGTAGTGLGAVRRLANEFDAFSTRPGGTVILARVRRRGAAEGAASTADERPIDVGAVALAAPGETVCGDSWSVAADGRRWAILVADGLGHGPVAQEASVAAVAEFQTESFAGPSVVLGRVHESLRSTRGAAVAIAQMSDTDDQIVFCGAGNISGRLISGVSDRTLISQHGTAGVQIRGLRDVKYDWPEHALLIMHSDGLKTRWSVDAAGELLQRHPSVVAAWLIRDQTRGPDDVTVVVLKRRVDV